MGDDREDGSALARALDRLAIAVLLIAPEGRVTFANAAAVALLGREGGLRLSGGRVVAGARGVATRIDDHLRRLTAASPGPQAGTRLCMTVPRTDAPYPYVVHVVPLGEAPGGGEAATAMAVIVDPAPAGDGGDATIGPSFGLTSAEWNVARRLGDGLTVDEVAREAEVSVNTVRTHLKKVFQKTGVRRQAELVRLVTLAAVVRGR